MNKKLVLVFILPLLFLMFEPSASAHNGETPSSGMHFPVGPIPTRPEGLPTEPLAPPLGDEIACPAEFCRADGVFLIFETRWGSTQILMDLAYEVAQDDSVYMVVKNASDRNEAIGLLNANGVNMDHVRFIFYPPLSENCIWVRDFGPVYIYEDGEKGIVDFWYPFTNDDDFPQTVGAEFDLPVYENDLLHSGGNFMTDGNGMGFATTIVYSYNPNYSQAEVRELFSDYCGIDSLVVLPEIDVENTKHIDVWCKIVGDTTLVVGEYESPSDGGGNNYYILNDAAAQLDTLRNLDGREFDVVRIPMPPWEGSGEPTRTYTNSLIINDKVLVPTYDLDSDLVAMDIYQSLLPDHEVIGIDSRQIIERAGAVHCITKLHHSDNPLVVLHQPLDSLSAGEEPHLRFCVNPRFDNTDTSVFWRPSSGGMFTEVPATFEQGVWQAALPQMFEDFQYYLAATSTSGFVAFDVTHPDGAPFFNFEVDVIPNNAVAEAEGPACFLECRPSLFRSSTQIHFAIPGGTSGSLQVYDVAGRAVRRFPLVAGGVHSVNWDGRDNEGRPVSAGFYLCRLRFGEESRSARLLLIR